MVKNLIGQKFGRLTVVQYEGQNKHCNALWVCRCECGNEKIVVSDSLIRGKTKSCGCLNQEQCIINLKRSNCGSFDYDFRKTRLYRIWIGMKTRCYNSNSEAYQKWYGSQGVKVCDNWRYCFQAFYRWSICHGYKDTLSIDRIDPTGNYEPSNCRWATAKQQANNKRLGGGHHPQP